MRSQHEYYIEIPFKQQHIQEEKYQKLSTPEDGHRYCMFVKGNDYLIDGRTYVFKDENGRYVSAFVSQYSDIIEKNLEPGVKDAVLSLHEKGYLTFTSCQGHDDSKHRYIGIVFNTLEQKKHFIKEVNKLKCDIHWYDNIINSVERPSEDTPWWCDGGITLHIDYDHSHANVSQIERREHSYTDEDLTNFWNIQMCRNYQYYEAIVFSFGYPMVEKSLWERIHKNLFYNHYKVTSAYYEFLNKVHKLPIYEA